MPLYDFQQKIVDDLAATLAKKDSVVVQSPTGTGKTIMAGEISRRISLREKRVLILVHRRELIYQFVDTLKEYGLKAEIGVIAPGYSYVPFQPIQIASVQSLVRRKGNLRPDFIFIDEAHHARAATWEKIFAKFPNAKRIGFTATPQRLDGKGLGSHFEDMIQAPPTLELIKQGYLPEMKVLRIPQGLSTKGVKTRMGDYDQKEVAKRVNATVVAAGAKAYIKYAKGKKAVFFGAGVRHSMDVAETLKGLGVKAMHLDGTSDARVRRDAVYSFKNGGIDVLCNADLFQEGFDAPGCQVVLDAAPTKSVTRYLQKAGRCARAPKGEKALFLDLAGNFWFLGRPDEERKWELGDKDTKNQHKTAIPKPKQYKTCQFCANVFLAYQNTCPECGKLQDTNKRVEEIDVDLEEAGYREKKKTIGKIKFTKKKHQMHQDLAKIRQLPIEQQWPSLLAYAKANNYKYGWARKYAQIVGMR